MACLRERVGICRRQFLSEGFVGALVFIATCLNLLPTSYAQEGFPSLDCGYLRGDGRNSHWVADCGMSIKTGNSSQQPALYANELVGAGFISSVELRLLDATVYSYTTIYSYNGSQMQDLSLLYDLAAMTSTTSVRLPGDELDRSQKITNKLSMTASVCYLKASDTVISIQFPPDDTTKADVYHVPRRVMPDTQLMNNVFTNISCFSTNGEGYGVGCYEPQAAVLFPLYTDYLYLTRAERFFSIIYARYLISSKLQNFSIQVVKGVPGPVLNFYHQATIQATPDFLLSPNSSAIEMSLSGKWIPSSPIINTLESYDQNDFNYTKTDPSNGKIAESPEILADLVVNRKASLNITNWQGYPHNPVTHDWLSNFNHIDVIDEEGFIAIQQPCSSNETHTSSTQLQDRRMHDSPSLDSISTLTALRFPNDRFDRLWNVPDEAFLKAASYDVNLSDLNLFSNSLPDLSIMADSFSSDLIFSRVISTYVATHIRNGHTIFKDLIIDCYEGLAGESVEVFFAYLRNRYLIRESIYLSSGPVELGSLSFNMLRDNTQLERENKTKKRRRRHLAVLDVSDGQPQGDQRSKSYVLIICICSASVGLLLCCITFVTLRKLCKPVRAPPDIEQALEDWKVHPLLYQYSDLKLATRDFHKDRELGRGAYGAVYKGVLANETKIAVKELFNSNRSQVLDEFLNEVGLITGIKHKNLILLKGCCINDKHRILVYEYAENGNLAQALWGSNRHGILNWEQRFNICVGVARGLSYLHEELQPSIVHRDIKPENILLDGNFKPKIADFGLARHYSSETSQAYYTTRIVGTLGYFAPEHISEGQISDKGDVYSYGIVVLEIVSGRKCIDHSLPSGEIYLKDWVRKLHQRGQLFDVLQPELRGSCVVAEVIRAIKIALSCVQYDPEMRPSMSQIVTMFSGSLDIDAFLNEHISHDVQEIMVTLQSDLEHPALDDVVEEDCAAFFLRNPDSQSSSGDTNNGRAESQIESSTYVGGVIAHPADMTVTRRE